ncbi:hypothetical protein ACFW04_006998 [Cataglyphis niger]
MQSAIKRYYNINKILIKKIGDWPNQNIYIKILLPTIIATVIFSQAFFEFVEYKKLFHLESYYYIRYSCQIGVHMYTSIICDSNMLLYQYHSRILSYYIILYHIGKYGNTMDLNSKEDDQLINKSNLTDYMQDDKGDEIYRELVLVLWKHQLSIEYVCKFFAYCKKNIINNFCSMYIYISDMFVSWILLSHSFNLIFITTMMTSFLGIQICSNVYRFFLTSFCFNYPGQRIIDHSSDLFHKASTRLLSILLYKCFVPCTLTAGKIYVLSLTNYASVKIAFFNKVSSCMSYFIAFSSFN